MLALKDVLQTHKEILATSEGWSGVRSLDLLKSALARPFATFEGVEFYPTIVQQAAVFLHGIVGNHPFVDGNKRVGYVVCRAFLLTNNIEISATEDEKYEFVVGIASGTITLEQAIDWLEKRTISL
jgi:death on curing protein